MQTTNGKDIAELVGIVAIVASLIFVGLEMRQTRSIALAATYQTRADSEMFLMSYIQQPDIRRVWIKVENDEVLSQDDEWILVGSLNIRFAYLENIHFQMENGMLSGETLNGHLLGISPMFAEPPFVEWWESGRDGWRPSFSRYVDEFIERIDRDNRRSD